MAIALCRWLFVLCVAYPVTYFWLGISMRHRSRMPHAGPAIVIANHNSHLDTLVLLTCFPLKVLPSVRIAAASDYFFSRPWKRFIATWFLGLVPVERTGAARDPLQPMATCLEHNGILILFPEGTRGQAEKLGTFKSGLWHLMRRCPTARLVPLYFHGLGRSLPKDMYIPVPMFIDAVVGEPIAFDANKQQFMHTVQHVFSELRNSTLARLHEEHEASQDPE